MEGTNPEAEPFFDELATAFQDETGAELDVQFVPWAEAHDKFVKSIAGGTTPDVAEVGTTWTPEFADAGALVDLTDAVNEAGLDDDLVSGLVEAGTVDDALYGMPWYSGVRSVVYRTDVFEKAGIEPPTTWDELVAAGEELKKAEPDMIPFPIAGDSEYGVYPFIWGNGGELAVAGRRPVDERRSTPRRRRRASSSTPAWPPSTGSPPPRRRRGTRPTSLTPSPAATSR